MIVLSGLVIGKAPAGAGIDGPQVVVAVGSGVSERIFSLGMKSLASMFAGFFLGGAIVIAIVILRVRAKRRLARLSDAPT